MVVIEHHSGIMAQADNIIEMGPGAGAEDDRIVRQGPPEHILKSKTCFLVHGEPGRKARGAIARARRRGRDEKVHRLVGIERSRG